MVHPQLLVITPQLRLMLTDGQGIPSNSVFDADLCVIATGPSGLAITQQLSNSKLEIMLIERGAVTYPPAPALTSDLDFESPHFHVPVGVLRSQVGGMATTWKPLFLEATVGARYLPLDTSDFESRYR